MKKVVLDTSVIIPILRGNEGLLQYVEVHYPANEFERILCFASKAEPSSMMLRRKWGKLKRQNADDFFEGVDRIIREVTDEMIDAYAELEAYSLNQHPTIKKPEGESAYKIGKNDLWIAATAQVEKARLFTADRGFVQFGAHFFPVDFIAL